MQTSFEETYDSKRDDFFDVDGDDFIMKIMDSTCQGFLSSNNNESSACLPACNNVGFEQQLEMLTVRVCSLVSGCGGRLVSSSNDCPHPNTRFSPFLLFHFLYYTHTALSTASGIFVVLPGTVFRAE